MSSDIGGVTPLREMSDVQQIPGQPLRRWFSSATMDLFVWCADSGAPVAFQLAYDKGHQERALSWKQSAGFDHNQVDDGDNPAQSKYKATPLLVRGGTPDIEKILHLLAIEGATLAPDIMAFLVDKIRTWQAEPA